MAINTSTFESTLQTKLDAVSDAKEMLLLGKALESTVGSIAVSDINTAGATKVAEINAMSSGFATTSSLAAVATSGQYSDVAGAPVFKTVGGQSIEGSGDIQVGGVLGDFAGLQGPVSKNSAYKNNWHSYVSSTSATFEAIGTDGSYTGIKILKAGVYECQYGQRGTVGLYGAISLDGDRVALEDAADKIWSHDHVPGVNAWAKGVCTGHFIVGDIISAGPSSTDLTYSTAGHSGWLIIKRLGDT